MDIENRMLEIQRLLDKDADDIARLRTEVHELKDKFTNLFAVSAILLAGVLLSLIIGT